MEFTPMQELHNVADTNYGQLQPDDGSFPDPTQVAAADTGQHCNGIERELYGKWTITLRNFCGVMAVLTTCLVAAMNGWTTYRSVSAGTGWPSDWAVVVVNVGPIICAWAYLSANKVITAILSSDTGEGLATRLRRRVANAVDPGGESPNNNGTNGPTQ